VFVLLIIIFGTLSFPMVKSEVLTGTRRREIEKERERVESSLALQAGTTGDVV